MSALLGTTQFPFLAHLLAILPAGASRGWQCSRRDLARRTAIYPLCLLFCRDQGLSLHAGFSALPLSFLCPTHGQAQPMARDPTMDQVMAFHYWMGTFTPFSKLNTGPIQPKPPTTNTQEASCRAAHLPPGGHSFCFCDANFSVSCPGPTSL